MAFVTVAIIGASIAGAGGLAKLGVSLAGRRDRINEQAAATAEMRKMKKEYQNLDTSNLAAGVRNPYENLENTFEDLTVNQQQAQFEAQQGQQSRANIMQGLQGAAGGSGIAGLAQSLANQGMLQSQKASASIGLQESQNQRMAAQQGARIQQLEGQGEMYAEQMRQRGAEAGRGLEWQKTSTLFGMSQQRTAAANEARRQAKAQQMSAIGDIASAGAQIATAGMKIPKLPGGVGDGVGVATKSFYPDPSINTIEQGPNFYGDTPEGTYNYGGQSHAPGYTPLLRKKNLKINKYK